MNWEKKTAAREALVSFHHLISGMHACVSSTGIEFTHLLHNAAAVACTCVFGQEHQAHLLQSCSVPQREAATDTFNTMITPGQALLKSLQVGDKNGGG